MRLPLVLLSSLIGLALFAGPSLAAEKCGFTVSGRWGIENNNTFVLSPGSAKAKSCHGVVLTLTGPKGTSGARPEDIMSAKGAASFTSALIFVARSFVAEDERIATPPGKMPWQIIPDPAKVTASETQLGLRKSDGLADTIFFRAANGYLYFFQVRAVEGASYDDLLAKGDLLNADL
jgi:hypothetical protein